MIENPITAKGKILFHGLGLSGANTIFPIARFPEFIINSTNQTGTSMELPYDVYPEKIIDDFVQTARTACGSGTISMTGMITGWREKGQPVAFLFRGTKVHTVYDDTALLLGISDESLITEIKQRLNPMQTTYHICMHPGTPDELILMKLINMTKPQPIPFTFSYPGTIPISGFLSDTIFKDTNFTGLYDERLYATVWNAYKTAKQQTEQLSQITHYASDIIIDGHIFESNILL